MPTLSWKHRLSVRSSRGAKIRITELLVSSSHVQKTPLCGDFYPLSQELTDAEITIRSCKLSMATFLVSFVPSQMALAYDIERQGGE